MTSLTVVSESGGPTHLSELMADIRAYHPDLGHGGRLVQLEEVIHSDGQLRDGAVKSFKTSDWPETLRIEIICAMVRFARTDDLDRERVRAANVRNLVNAARENGWESMLDATPGQWLMAMDELWARTRTPKPSMHFLNRGVVRHFVQAVHNRVGSASSGPDRSELLQELPEALRGSMAVRHDEWRNIWRSQAHRHERPWILAVPDAVRVELLWAIARAEKSGELLIDPTYLWAVIYAVTDKDLTALGALTAQQWVDVIDEMGTARAVGTTRRDNIETFVSRLIYPVLIRTSEREWWEWPVWHPRYDDRVQQGSAKTLLQNHISVGRIELLWLRRAWAYYASRMLIRSRLSWATIGTRTSVMATHVGPFFEAHHVTGPHLAATDEEVRALLTRLFDYFDSSFTRPGMYRSWVKTFFEFLHYAREELVAHLDHSFAEFPAEAYFYAAAEPKAKGRGNGATTEPMHVYLDQVAITTLLQLTTVMAAPLDVTVRVELPGRAPLDLQGCGGEGEARVIKIMASTGRRLSDVTHAPFDCIRPLAMIRTDDAAEDGAVVDLEQRSDDPFVANWLYGTVKTGGTVYRQIPIRQSTLEVIKEQQAHAQSQVDEYHAGHPPRYLFLSANANRRGTKPMTSVGHRLKLLADQVQVFDGEGSRIPITRTHQLRVTKVCNLLDEGVPLHITQEYIGHDGPEMTVRYWRARDSVIVAHLERAGFVGAGGADVDGMDFRQFEALSYMEGRADRVLPHGLCTLPPTQVCDKGNACFSCSLFVTHAGMLPAIKEQARDQQALIERRRSEFLLQRGREMPDTNVWLVEAQRQLHSMRATIGRLEEGIDAAPSGGRRVLPIVQTASDRGKSA